MPQKSESRDPVLVKLFRGSKLSYEENVDELIKKFEASFALTRAEREAAEVRVQKRQQKQLGLSAQEKDGAEQVPPIKNATTKPTKARSAQPTYSQVLALVRQLSISQQQQLIRALDLEHKSKPDAKLKAQAK